MSTAQKVTISILVATISLFGIAFFIFHKTAPSNPISGTSLFPESSSSGTGSTSNTPKQSGTNSTSSTSTDAIASDKEFKPVLKQLSHNAVSGFTVMRSGLEPIVRYSERETGHIIDISPTTLETTTVSNTTLPKIQTAIWSPKGDKVIFRSITAKGVDTAAYAVPAEAGKEGAIVPIAFPANTLDFVFSPDSKKVFFLERNGVGVVGKILDLATSAQKQIFSSPLAEWLLEWNSPQSIILTTKPSAGVSGFAISLDEKGNETRLIGNRPGLTVLGEPQGKQILFSESADTRLATGIFNRTTETPSQYPIVTLPEKCTWSHLAIGGAYCAFPVHWPSAEMPDDWYKGLVFTDDAFAHIGSRFNTLYLRPSKERGGEALDATHLAVDRDEQFLYFINKLDGTLWSVQLYR